MDTARSLAVFLCVVTTFMATNADERSFLIRRAQARPTIVSQPRPFVLRSIQQAVPQTRTVLLAKPSFTNTVVARQAAPNVVLTQGGTPAGTVLVTREDLDANIIGVRAAPVSGQTVVLRRQVVPQPASTVLVPTQQPPVSTVYRPLVQAATTIPGAVRLGLDGHDGFNLGERSFSADNVQLNVASPTLGHVLPTANTGRVYYQDSSS